MIKIENTETYGWETAIRGMRNPMNSWDKSDSSYGCDVFYRCNSCGSKDFCNDRNTHFVIGENDLKLMQKLANAGTDHSKFLRMITVTCDITAPRFWWVEADTYKVGTVRNSCSTMHKIHAKEFTMDDFSHEHLTELSKNQLSHTIKALNFNRELYNAETDKENKKKLWYQMIVLLPQSYNQRATMQFNYQVLRNIRNSDRKTHKLDEWREGFMNWIDSLPYAEELLK